MADISKFNPDGGATEYNFKDTTARNIRGNYYGTCTGQASNQIKAVTISNDQGFELKTGVLIFVKFDANNTYSATSSNHIKLNVNNTGNIDIYSASGIVTGTNTTYYGRTNYINQYVYNGTYWVWAGSSADNNSGNTNLGYADPVKAASDITAKTLCVGNSTGYKSVVSGLLFDISYPILYASSAVSSGSTGKNFFRVQNFVTSTNLKSGFTGTMHSVCYLVLSSIVGVTGTIDSTVFTVTPNVNGKYYIPIGIFTDSTEIIDIDLTFSNVYIYDNGTLKLYSPGSGGGGGFTPIVLPGTLEAGETEITFTDSSILADSMIDIFIDSDEDLYPTSKTSTVGEVVLEFDAQSSDLNIALLIFNLMN